MCTNAIVVNDWELLCTKDSACSCTLVRKGMTHSVFMLECGVLGMPRAVQKSSARQPVQYLCRMMGVDSLLLLL